MPWSSLADKLGAFNMILPCLVAAGALQWILLACGSTGGIIVFAILYGFFSGAYVSLLPSVNVAFARSLAEVGGERRSLIRTRQG